MFDIFSTREIAFVFYLLLIIIFVFVKDSIRPSVISVIKLALSKKLIIPFIGMCLYCILLVHFSTFLPFWNWIYIKDVIIWFLFAGVSFCYNAINSNLEDNYFRNIIFDNLGLSVLIGFFISTFTFNIFVELILQPVIVFFILIQAMSETKEEYKQVKELLDWIIGILGLIILLFTIKEAIVTYSEHSIIDTIVSFFIPIVFSLLYIPIAYLFALYSKYEIVFMRMSFMEPKDKKIKRQHRYAVLRLCKFSYKKICMFERNCIKNMYITMSQNEFNNIINTFNEIKMWSDMVEP